MSQTADHRPLWEGLQPRMWEGLQARMWQGLAVGYPDSSPLWEGLQLRTHSALKGLPQFTRVAFLPLSLLLFLLIPAVAPAGVPAFVTYSGRLTDGTGWGESTQLSLTFRIYDQETGGATLFEQTEEVVVQDGYFSVMLQDATEVFTGVGQTWIGVSVEGGAELAPRQAVGSVPYATHARSVDLQCQSFSAIYSTAAPLTAMLSPECPEGWVRTGGGCRVIGEGYLVRNKPSGGSYGHLRWACMWKGSGTAELKAYVVCCRSGE